MSNRNYEHLSKEIAERIKYDREHGTLPNFAAQGSKAKRRDMNSDKESAWRPAYLRDVDKILHSPYYNRYTDKTQVFSFYKNDDITRRALHVQLVSRTARTLGAVLGLNIDLIEAISLGHDIGHTPFGHAGEDAMRKCYSSDFSHYKQSLRVIDILENDGKGLNLTWEVRDGIVNHTGSNMASTLEGVIVKYADRIAYINHDIDDACRAGILSPDDIPADIRATLGDRHSDRINTMVLSIVKNSTEAPYIAMEDDIQDAADRLRDFLFDNVYHNPKAKSEESKAQDMLLFLFEYYVKNPDKLPALYQRRREIDPIERCACDFISGMTDRYATEVFTDICVPKVWRGRPQ